jgi:hypothetical protein
VTLERYRDGGGFEEAAAYPAPSGTGTMSPWAAQLRRRGRAYEQAAEVIGRRLPRQRGWAPAATTSSHTTATCSGL